MFAPHFALHADRPCLRDGARTLSYAETLALGRSLVAGLERSRSLVILRCSLTAECVAAYVALLDAGHVPLLLEADLAGELVDHLAELYQVDAILDPSRGIEPLVGGTALHPDLALLLTTSGSTGSPKLVRLSHSGVLANAQAIARSLALDADECPLLHLPMSYSYGLSVIHSHLVTGGCIGLTRSSVMEPGYFDDLVAYEATSIAGVPFHYTALRRLLGKIQTTSIRTLTQAGGRLDPKLVGFFAEWAATSARRFIVMYGQTEAGPRIALLPPERARDATDAIGLPIPGVTVHLLDQAGAPVADGAAGEMVVESPGVMMGYAHTAGDLALGDQLGGRLKTGDIAVRGADGLLRVVGRSSRIVKVYGLRVNADEVEQRLAGLGHGAICFGSDDTLRILIEGSADAAAVRQHVVDLFSLPPRGIEVRTATVPVARTASGKLSARARDAAWDAGA
jgi:acyl-CoA synthetase (AMP-forming)/AMP-acid ligase II